MSAWEAKHIHGSDWSWELEPKLDIDFNFNFNSSAGAAAGAGAGATTLAAGNQANAAAATAATMRTTMKSISFAPLQHVAASLLSPIRSGDSAKMLYGHCWTANW